MLIGRILGIILLLLLVILGGLALYGAWRWRNLSQNLQQQLESQPEGLAHSNEPLTVDFAELEPLPEPVQHYFRKALSEGQAMISSVDIWQRGSFNMGQTPASPQWREFSAYMLIKPQAQGFHWNASVAMPLGLHVRVHDSYVARRGYLAAAFLGAIPVMEFTASPELDRGELLRFFAEAFWYPTALLPSQGVTWQAVGDYQARATLTFSDAASEQQSISMLVTFDTDYLPSNIVAERPRQVEDTFILTPWEVRLYDFYQQDGMLIPQGGEVLWQLSEGEMLYWRGQVDEVVYTF